MQATFVPLTCATTVVDAILACAHVVARAKAPCATHDHLRVTKRNSTAWFSPTTTTYVVRVAWEAATRLRVDIACDGRRPQSVVVDGVHVACLREETLHRFETALVRLHVLDALPKALRSARHTNVLVHDGLFARPAPRAGEATTLF